MCYVIQKTAPGRGAVDGQKEDEGQGDQERRSEEGHQDGEYQAQDREGCEEAAPAGCEDIATGARGPHYRRVAGKHGPAPRLVAVSLLDALIPNGERQAILTPSSKAWYPAPEQGVSNNAKRQASKECGAKVDAPQGGRR
ncbi:MAG: hypothetical protein E6J55_02530 [Deltaproteobacteria bacterium]|nr:MAG: hypothetical protein E6J55_02530 [Deltaproteobacteria bacterium]